MHKYFLRAFVSPLALLLSLSSAAALTSRTDPLDGIEVKKAAKGVTIYRTRPEIWPVRDIWLGALMTVNRAGTRSLALAVSLRGVDRYTLGPVTIHVDGSTTSLELKGRGKPDVERLGCLPAKTTVVIEAQDDLVRQISKATDVGVEYGADKTKWNGALMPSELERFKRVVDLRDMSDLPPASEASKEKPNYWRPRVLPSEGATNPVLISTIQPQYPQEALSRGGSGHVTLLARILKDGTIGSVRPVSAFPEGCAFEEAAIDSVKASKYKPATKGGEPIEVDWVVVIDFSVTSP